MAEPGIADIRSGCAACAQNLENLCLCLGCTPWQPLCREHMRAHAAKAGHTLALNVADLAFRCYRCDAYVWHESLWDAFRSVHETKYGCPPGHFASSRYARRTPEPGQPELGRQPPAQGLSADWVRGCIFGQALGDAVGLATEYLSEPAVQAAYGEGPIPFPNNRWNFHNTRWMLGDWTDDTDQLICILDAFLETGDGQIDPLRFARRLHGWMNEGFRELGDWIGVGTGDTVRAVVSSPYFRADPRAAARAIWEQSGRRLASNGAVMRAAVVGCLHGKDHAAVAADAETICRVTHAEPRCVLSCVAVAVASAASGQPSPGGPPRWDAVLAEVKASWGGVDAPAECKEEGLKYLEPPSLVALGLDEPDRIGYTFKTMGAAFWGLSQVMRAGGAGSFERMIDAIVRQGGDADTNAAVAGALAGCHLGFAALPGDWVQVLPFRGWLEGKVRALVQLLRDLYS
jgi:ADP-ribosylglycohydrolase